MQPLPYAGLLLLACFPLVILPQLVARPLLIAIVMLGGYLLRRRRAYLHYLGATLLFFALSQWSGHALLTTLNTWSERVVSAEVKISELHTLTGRMKIQLVKINGHWQFPVYGAWIAGIEPEEYCPGQRWLMTLRLRPVHSLLNQGGYDSQRNALAKEIPFTAKIYQQQLLNASCSVRYRLEQTFLARSHSSPWQGISRALVFGLRDHISATTNTLFRETGIGHLMAISGMHIGLVFFLVTQGLRIIQSLLPPFLSDSRVNLVVGWLCSAGYCYLSGAQPSAMRALFALTFWIIAKRYAVNLSSYHILLLCIASLLFIHPVMILSESLWLSALAVLALLLWYQWFPLPPRYWRGKGYALVRLLHLQIGLMILLLPIQIFFFQGTSLMALGANMIAIPLVSLGILPLALVLMFPWPDPLYTGLLLLHDSLYQLLFAGLSWQRGGWYFLSTASWFACLAWGGVILLRFYWWRSFPLSLITLLLSLASWRVQPSEWLWRVDMLDVGHGLAVVISQQGEGIIYDTGNRWQVSDAGERIIVPWLKHQQIVPILAIISHRHSDHSGGLSSIKKVWPHLPVRTSYPYPGALPCRRGEAWQWGRLSIRILWPQQAATAGQNNDSCVLYVSDGQHHLLLTGDIEKQAEQQIAALEKAGLPVSWLQVPHHGSRTSSTALFLRKFNADLALASVARYNAWRLPAKTVVKRYQDQGVTWLETAQSGQISIRIAADNAEILQLRDQISPRWYHQWFGVKPDYG